MRVLVTRPAREAQRWVHELRLLGVDAAALPLIEIAQPPDEDLVRREWARLDRYQAVMFVSGNAVERFFALRPPSLPAWPRADARAWAPGPGTRDALVRAGLPLAAVDQPDAKATQFDSQALWEQVKAQAVPGCRVLVVRGGDAAGQGSGRDWLARQLAKRGVEVDTVVAYSRRAAHLTPAQRELAQAAAADGSVWLFSSSEAIGHLRAELSAQGWGGARAIATHPRIGQAATDAGFGVVRLSRPTLAEVVASIESIR
ncbi:uroporphyrinogen-III synthase [Caenimonas terrae]|uniref:Uroporphyrinogen-III synthase n=1 Tax=Caenimonas terrae TaxID=696074 RepID=A0ABW0NFL3_9BURK